MKSIDRTSNCIQVISFAGALLLAACGGSSTAVGTGGTGTGSGGTTATGGSSGTAGTGTAGTNPSDSGFSGATHGGNGIADCAGPCCRPHNEGTQCDSGDEGVFCPRSILCEGGLSIDQHLVCMIGSWTLQGESCPSLDGGVTAEGCPAAQPNDGDSCSVPDGSGSCLYHLICTPKPCDAGPPPTTSGDDAGGAAAGYACASLTGKVAFAICTDGHWATTPLGTCP
jgi:hypothetical protein